MRPLYGIGLKIASVLVFLGMSSIIKYTADRIPTGETMFFRSAFAIPVLLAWLWWRGELSRGVGTKDPQSHFWRGLVGSGSMFFSFAALAYIPLPEATALNYTAPLLVVIFAAMFLNEKVGVWRLSAVALGMAGVMIILAPRLSAGSEATSASDALGATLAISGAVCAALAQIFVRKLVATERTAVIVFWFSFNAALLSLLTIPFGWVMPSPTDAALLITAGLLGGIAQILMTSSYREADASVIAPFEYASMIFALLIGWFVFNEAPTLAMLGGAALIMAAGVLIIWREHKLGKDRSKQRKATPQGS